MLNLLGISGKKIKLNMKPTIPLCGACRHFNPAKEKWLGDCMKQHSARLASDKACKYFTNQDKQK